MLGIHRSYRRNDQPRRPHSCRGRGLSLPPSDLIVTCTPSGPSDVHARIIGRQMEKVLGQRDR
jgi:hypothetical protein